MTRRRGYITSKSKGISLILISTMVLLCAGIANGKSRPLRKQPSSRTLRSMARIYMAYGEYERAQPLAEKALITAKEKGAEDCELAMCFIDLATLYKNQGKLLDAEESCKLGFELQQKGLYKKHPYLAYTLRTLASIYHEQGKYLHEKAALDRAVAIMHESHSADDKTMAPFMVDIARLHTAQGDFQKAESYYHKAIGLINNSYGPDHLYTAKVLTSIAGLYTMQKRYTEAERLISQAVATQERIYGSDHHLIAESWLIKAKVYQARGDYSRAEGLITKALDAVEKSGNKAALAKSEQTAEEIRSSRQVAYKPVAKATE